MVVRATLAARQGSTALPEQRSYASLGRRSPPGRGRPAPSNRTRGGAPSARTPDGSGWPCLRCCRSNSGFVRGRWPVGLKERPVPQPERSSNAARDIGTAFRRVQRRLRAAAVLRAIAVGLLAATVGAVLERAVLGVHPAVRPVVAIALFLAVAVTMLLLRRRSWTTKAAAASIEAANPQSRNLIVTAEELRRHPERATPRVVERVLAEAARFAGAVDIGSAVPLTRDIAPFSGRPGRDHVDSSGRAAANGLGDSRWARAGSQPQQRDPDIGDAGRRDHRSASLSVERGTNG